MHQPRFGSLSNHDFVFDGHSESSLIMYYQEDPAIRELYERELANVDLESAMPEECNTDSDYDFGM